MNEKPLLVVIAEGRPRTAGSKSSGVVTRKDPATGKRVPVQGEDGRYKTFTKDSSGEQGDAWRGVVAAAGSNARVRAELPVLDCPLLLSMVFCKPRSATHYRKDGTLRASAPAHPSTRPDVVKLARAVEDALTGVVWTDDARVVEYRPLAKVFVPRGEPERVEVAVWPLDERVGERLPSGQVELAVA